MRPSGIAIVSPGASGKFGLLPATFLPGRVVYADSSAGSTAPQFAYPQIPKPSAWPKAVDHRWEIRAKFSSTQPVDNVSALQSSFTCC